MRYVALLRGINVGGNNKVEMIKLKQMMASLGFTKIETYLNSGNALFDSDENQATIERLFLEAFETAFGFSVPILIKSQLEIKTIAEAIPNEWLNDKEQKTDVAYLFSDVDDETILDEIPAKKEYVDMIYIKGAVIWHTLKKDYNKSQLNKIISRKIYKMMTVRNVNTARFLAKDT